MEDFKPMEKRARENAKAGKPDLEEIEIRMRALGSVIQRRIQKEMK